MNNFPPRATVENLKAQYPKGTRVELVNMQDPYTYIAPGTQGTVEAVDDIGTVHVKWDDGHRIGAAYGADKIRKIG